MEVASVDFFKLRRSEGSGELSSELIPGVDVATWEVRVPMLSEALQREDKRFDFACRASSGCFDGRFVLEEEVFWVGIPIELRENGGVEAWRPQELFELCRERRGEALLRAKVLRSKLLWHHVLAFLFV